MSRPCLLALLGALLGACGGASTPPNAGPVSSERSSLAATPAQAIADGISEVILTATALDSSGAPVPGAAVDFTASLGALSSARVVTGSAGVATTTLRSTRPGNATVGASVGGVVLGTPAQVSFVAGPAATLRVTAQPSGGTAGVGLVELSVEARDANDNATTFPAEVTVSLRTSPAGAVLSGTSRATPAGARRVAGPLPSSEPGVTATLSA